jgi:hypothetical protein
VKPFDATLKSMEPNSKTLLSASVSNSKIIPNYFFNGELTKDGECIIQIPRLKNLDSKSGKLTVEAVADSVYFKVYEADVELKNSVEVNMSSPAVKKARTPKVKLETIVQADTVEAATPETPLSEGDQGGWEPLRAPEYKSYKKATEENPKSNSLRTFTDYLRERNA